MSSKRKNKVLVLIIVILILSVGGFLLRDRSLIGKKIDSYKNVNVYYNGIIYTRAYGENYSNDGYFYGQKWQCVEFVKRFYFMAKNHRMPDVWGNAKDFFDDKLPQGELNNQRGLIQYKNGGNVKPAPDDLIVFTDTKFGHVAIVTKVTSDNIEVIQQNIYGHPRQLYKLTEENGKYIVGDKRKPAGWLRKK